MLEVTYIKAHLKLLTIVFLQWPFSKWGIDIVIVNYFTKWDDALPLTCITKENLAKFIEKIIKYKFWIRYSFVSDVALQLDNTKANVDCKWYNIRKNGSTPLHPHSNKSRLSER